MAGPNGRSGPVGGVANAVVGSAIPADRGIHGTAGLRPAHVASGGCHLLPGLYRGRHLLHRLGQATEAALVRNTLHVLLPDTGLWSCAQFENLRRGAATRALRGDSARIGWSLHRSPVGTERNKLIALPSEIARESSSLRPASRIFSTADSI